MGLTIQHGITGNYYCYSENKALVEDIAQKVGKAKSSIKFYEKASFIADDVSNVRINKVWVFRTKDKEVKKKLKHIKEKIKL